MIIGVLGSGDVGRTLAAGLMKHGHEVMVGTRDPRKLEQWKEKHPTARIGTFAETAEFGDPIVLAVKGTAASEVLRAADPGDLAGKTVMDATNPIADAAPESGVLRFFTSLDESLMERLQHEFARAHFVKVFNSVGNACMVDPEFPGGPPTMFICGNDEAAKNTVASILDQLGWDVADMGTAAAARAIEPLCMLWCIPGFLRDDWRHAFKLLRVQP